MQCIDIEDEGGKTVDHHSEEVKCESNYVCFTLITVAKKKHS